ncbi:hypothetical protein GCM10009840_19110 [Pseudolysinimonas kribbensis]|uniref:Restriction endonuclease subunit S n=1 Tax=Pseudolysinimonas kribbensis TaxID=433641 RepID=A0ABQ6K494_9MICO|nr:restriction endonuclease subunit S [Pseudolysinimonas kribbensis]
MPWLSPKDMGDEVLVQTRDHVTAAAVDDGRAKVVPAGSVAVVVRSGILERTVPIAIVPFETTLNQDMKAIVPSSDVDVRWIAWALRSQERQILAGDRKSGTTVASLDSGTFSSRTIPVPPLAEQRRIVDILEGHLSRLDRAEELFEHAVAGAGIIARRYGDVLLTSVRDPIRPLGKLLREPMRNGISAPATKASSGVRTLTLTAVTKGEFTEANTKLTSADPARAVGLWLEKGDVLVERSNTPELVGTSAMYRGSPEWAIFPDLMIRVRVDGAIVVPEYLELVLQSSVTRQFLTSHAKGLAGSMPKIDQPTLARVSVPLPPIPAQREVVDRWRSLRESSLRLRSAITVSRTRSASLRRALLTAAFSGRLTGRASDTDRIEELADASHDTR